MTLLLVYGLALVIWGVWLSAGVVRGTVCPKGESFGVALARGLPACVEDTGLAGEALELPCAHGDKCHAFRVTGDNPDGPKVLILHAHGSGRFSSLGRLAEMPAWISQGVAVTMRGHDADDSTKADFGAVADQDVNLWLKHLGWQPQDTILCGASLGATVAVRAALQIPLRGVILEGACVNWREGLKGNLRRLQMPNVLAHLVSPWVEWYCPHLRKENLGEWVAELSCSVVWIHAEDDPICPLAPIQEIAQKQGQPLFIMPLRTHTRAFIERPDLWRDAIEKALSSISPTDQKEH